MVGRHGQGVAALVLGMPRVALEPVEGHPVAAEDRVEPQPQVHVLLLGEAGALPVLEPALVDGFHDVGGVAPDMDLRVLPADGLEPLHHGEELHPVVRGEPETFRELLPERPAAQDHAIPARAGVAASGPVGVQEYGWPTLFHGNAKIALSGQ